MKENLIATKTFDFALSIIDLFIQLKKENEFIISKQIIRSGTSIGANVEEAIAAQSKKDFINKLSIASKEARETKDKMINDAKEQAKIEANKIITEAQAAINAQKMAALTEVKNQAGKLVIEVSEKVLRRELSDKSAQEAHIKGLVDSLKLN